MPHPDSILLLGLAMMLTLVSIIIYKCLQRRTEHIEAIASAEKPDEPDVFSQPFHEKREVDDDNIETISTGALNTDDVKFICVDIVQSILQDALDHDVEEQPTAMTPFPYQFANETVDIEDACDRHHSENNHPGWSCNHCRITEQNRIDNEQVVRDLRTQLMFAEAQLRNHQVFIEKFEDGLNDVLKQNQELAADNASLKITVFQKEGRIKTVETLLKDVERMHVDASDKLDILKEHHEHVLERNHQLTAQRDELTLQVVNLQGDCSTLSKAVTNREHRMKKYQLQFEKDLVECKDRMEFQLREFAN